MLEKLPINYVRKLYNVLTEGNEDVNFCCLCLHNQNREAAINNPVSFGINLVKLNILCRIPIVKKYVFSKKIGKNYLSSVYVRPTITELASGLLDNKAVITDVFDCAVSSLKSDCEIFKMIEEKTGVKGFAKIRRKYDDKTQKIEHIYEKINSALNSSVDYHIELDLRMKFYIPNRYVVRLLDIATFNNLKIYACINSSLPGDFIKSVMNEFDVPFDVMTVSSEDDFEYPVPENPALTDVLSSDYSFIKRYLRLGCVATYYRKPETVMHRIRHPKINREFREVYDIICGNRLFSGLKRYSREYELAYLCLAPYIQSCREKNNNIITLSANKILETASDEVKKAVEDYFEDFENYSRQTGTIPHTAFNDGVALYKVGENQMSELFC